MNRVKAIEALLSELAKFASVINQDFPLEAPGDVDFFTAARTDLERDAFSDEAIEKLIKLLLSAELWLHEFAQTGKHEGILYPAQFVGQVIRNKQQESRDGTPVNRNEVLILVRRDNVLKDFNAFQNVRFPIGVARAGIAITITSILDATIQPFMKSSGWKLGDLPDVVPRLMHPDAEELFWERFDS